VATGGGRFASYLRESISGLGMLVGIDFDLEVVLRSRESLARIPDMNISCMDSAVMAFNEETFQLVCISNSLHHMRNLQETLSEMMRVLQPGGWFIVSEMYRDGQTPAQMTHVLLHHWWASIDRANGLPHFGTFTREDILKTLSALPLEDTIMCDSAYLETDPFSEEALRAGNSAIDSYIEKSLNLPDHEDLASRGEELRKHLQENGLHMATVLTLAGRKPR